IVKEQCRFVFAAARGVHITLSRFRVKQLFSLFSGILQPPQRENPSDPAACLPLFRVSGGAL
ncbi:hypothetical protein, partial [Leclercia sp. UBA2479]|uniref:hypothetical protein n=1 Tax=Leclercia sp. UBA2479 TaxID=1946738 RepID=UPI00257AB542